MRFNWSALLGGLVGGAVTAVVAGIVVARYLPEVGSDHTLGGAGVAALAAALSGAVGVIVGWLVHRRRGRGLGGIAAIVTVLGAGWGTWTWFTASWGVTGIGRTVVEGILILGLGMLVLATACGMTAALLQHRSRHDPEAARLR
ncbi:hypothetical protein [Ornithinimicrobium pratense]|uniref:Uncharacterized protein n=1 Tax=Ornithinimicrobium pratense TaxID=2593973 RepID=A0A5J6V1N2_9MICO|nr:hypothetical protein [Ornithinimicrobium pratense]QFG67720.1 hypothetical protein FY030_02355 [Ornithinimicrobium pratense]